MILERRLEPEVMDSAEEALDYDSMDHTEVNQRFVADLLAAGEVSGNVLDLGTGTAQIPIVLCQQQPDCRVMAIDLSIEMLDLGRYNIEAEGLIERITLDHVDAKDLPYEDDMFDTVISNSIIHHVADPTTVLSGAVRVVRAGGLLFFRDLMRPADEQTVERLVETYAGCENDHQRQMFADSLRAALTLEEIRTLVQQLGFAAESAQATSDRHWTWIARKVERCART